MGPNAAKRGETRPNGAKMWTNGDKKGQSGQNLLKDGDCPRYGDHPRDSYCPMDIGHTRNGYHTSNGDHHKGW